MARRDKGSKRRKRRKAPLKALALSPKTPASPRKKALKPFLRYLIVGGFNTLFGYSLFALITYSLTPWVPYSYELATLLSGLLSITFSYLSYKHLVFKTRGRYLREWFRALTVYGGGIVLNLILLPPLVFFFDWLLQDPAQSPYLGGLVLVGVQVLLSFFGHKKYTFA